MHSYDVREPIEVRVLPDRIEIVSHPGADRSISMEGLKNYRAASRRYRNRRIGEFLKELRLTEGRNTGFQKIRRALQSKCRLIFFRTIHAANGTSPHDRFVLSSYHIKNASAMLAFSVLFYHR